MLYGYEAVGLVEFCKLSDTALIWQPLEGCEPCFLHRFQGVTGTIPLSTRILDRKLHGA